MLESLVRNGCGMNALPLPVPEPFHAKATILVVDDMPENIEVIGGLLHPLYTVRVATSGERALRAARSVPRPDLILLDIMMPQMDGYAVLAALRESPETRDIPIIFVTAMNADENEQLGLDLGAVDYINKPIRPAILLARVRNQLELKQARDRLSDWNGTLQAEVQRRMRESELVRDVTLHALATLAEQRDGETGNHLYRTKSFVHALGAQLLRTGQYVEQLAGGLLEQMVRAAPLHDIGKVGIPDEILLKPGKLTPAEFEIMKGHARIGADAIGESIRRAARDSGHDEVTGREALAFLRVAQEIAAGHHEKWDGSGYPAGLAGAAIPLSARLMAIADVFDALSTRRVYKDRWELEHVNDFLRDKAGTHFDPALVEAYFAVQDEFRAIAEQYADTASLR
jgi:putative two-component system response regulator